MRTGRSVVTHAARAAVLLAVMALTGPGLLADVNDAFQIQVAPVTVAPGDMAEMVITIALNKGYRLIGEPPPNKFSTPLMVTFDATRALQPRTAIVPTPRTFTEEPQTFTYHAYEGTIMVKVPFKANDSAAPGDYTLHGRVRYQALIIENDMAGFLKTTVKNVDATVHIAARKK
jgi:DsbC/DsbD-like thiol-disulfide interchange protein